MDSRSSGRNGSSEYVMVKRSADNGTDGILWVAGGGVFDMQGWNEVIKTDIFGADCGERSG
jgi:hypothetical protein